MAAAPRLLPVVELIVCIDAAADAIGSAVDAVVSGGPPDDASCDTPTDHHNLLQIPRSAR
jgi:hypothetical protein